MSTYWMRWIEFSRLPPLFRIVASAPGTLTPRDLEELAIAQGTLTFSSGKPIGRTNRYHHRRALERLGLVVKTDGRYYPNLPPDERDTMLIEQNPAGLTDEQRILLSDRVIRNDDCYDVFWSSFTPGHHPKSVKEFLLIAQPVLLHVQEPPKPTSRYSSSVELRGTSQDTTNIVHKGYSAVEAIHYGMRRWGIEQLRFLDELYQVGQGHHLFPIVLNPRPKLTTIDHHLFKTLQFEGDWAVPRVGNLLLSVASELKIPISIVRDRLLDWLLLYANFVAPVRVSERMILYGRSKRIRELTMAGYLTPENGGIVSHIKVHRRIQIALEQENVKAADNDFS